MRLELPDLQIIKGRFTIYAFLLDGAGLHIYDRQILADAFAVESPRYAIGLVPFKHSWSGGAAPAAPAEAARRETPLHV